MNRFAILTLTLFASLAPAQEAPKPVRFDFSVRNYFFAGFSGNKAALEKGMAITSAILADNPNHGEALVWHGSGMLMQSGDLFRKGEQQKGLELWMKGVELMDKGVAVEPDDIGVRAARGGTYSTVSRFAPPAQGKEMLRKALDDYEALYRLQNGWIDKLSDHARGELLFGLGEMHDRLGNTDRAKEFLGRIVAGNGKTAYEADAKEYLETGKLTKRQNCRGCHVSSGAAGPKVTAIGQTGQR